MLYLQLFKNFNLVTHLIANPLLMLPTAQTTPTAMENPMMSQTFKLPDSRLILPYHPMPVLLPPSDMPKLLNCLQEDPQQLAPIFPTAVNIVTL